MESCKRMPAWSQMLMDKLGDWLETSKQALDVLKEHNAFLSRPIEEIEDHVVHHPLHQTFLLSLGP